MNYTKEELEKFWNFVKVADYKSDNDYNRINKLLFSKYAEDAELFYEIFHELSSVLYDEYEDAWLDEPGIEVSDDGWDDLRADIVSETNQRDNFQSIAPQVEAGLYLVPKVIE